jgi:hypothetical protein
MRLRIAVTILLTGWGLGWARPTRADDMPVESPHSLYLTHGVSLISSRELRRLEVPTGTIAVGAGVGYLWANGFGLDADLMAIDSTANASSSFGFPREWSEAKTWYHQNRLTLGGSYRHSLARHFVIGPEGGLSFNSIEVGLYEGAFRLKEHDDPIGWYLGIVSAIPINRVFFDFRAKYHSVKLDMPRLGVDSEMTQLTLLAGFGFVL